MGETSTLYYDRLKSFLVFCAEGDQYAVLRQVEVFFFPVYAERVPVGEISILYYDRLKSFLFCCAEGVTVGKTSTLYYDRLKGALPATSILIADNCKSYVSFLLCRGGNSGGDQYPVLRQVEGRPARHLQAHLQGRAEQMGEHPAKGPGQGRRAEPRRWL